jgi:hypothetical protein
MSKKIDLSKEKSPIILIYGSIKDITTGRVKGKLVSWVQVQTKNRRLHKLLYFGDAPKQMVVGGERCFVVSEKLRTEMELKPIVSVSETKVIGKDAKFSIKLESKEGHSIEREHKVPVREVYVKEETRILDLVILDLSLNPQSI